MEGLRVSTLEHSFLNDSLGRISHISKNIKEDPLIYSSSSSSEENPEIKISIMKNQYQRRFNEFKKDLRKRTEIKINRLDNVIKRAAELNSMLTPKNGSK